MSMHSDPTAPVKGAYSDGRAPVSTPVSVTLGNDGLVIEAEGWMQPRVWGYHELTTTAPLKARAGDCLLHCGRFEGATLFLEAPLIGGRLAAKAPQLSAFRMRFDGMKPGLATLAGVVTVVAALALSGFSPAQTAAKSIPDPARAAIGRNAVMSLARSHKECETPASRAALQRLTTRLATAARKDPLTVQVRVLNWGLVNAFAMPGGQLVLTRGLLQQASSPDEVAGVLAHEIGHALELHPETGLVRTAGFGALAQLMFAGSAGTMTNIGVFLTEVQYTRVNEQEADAHAVRILKAAGISPKGLSDFFKRIDDPDAERSVFNSAVVRTHPLTKERIAFVDAQPRYPSTPALSAEDWEALRSACGAAPADPRREDERIVGEASRALAQKPDDVTQLQRRARAFGRLDRHALALQDWDRLIVLRPKDSQGHVGRGNSLDALKRYEEAVTAYDRALELSPRNGVILNRRALAKRALKRFDEALRDFDQLLEDSPNFTAGHYNRGLVLLDVKRPDDAMRAFTATIGLDKDYTAAYTHRGILHMDAGRNDAAIAEFRLALAAQGKQSSATWGRREALAGLRKLGVVDPPREKQP